MMGTFTQVVADLSVLNAILALVVSVGAGLIVLLPRIDDGLIPKIGLCVLSLAQFATAVMLYDGSTDGDTIGLLRAQTCTRIGLVVLGLGIFWRHSDLRQRLSVFFAASRQKTHI
jgi:hypothetical protein